MFPMHIRIKQEQLLRSKSYWNIITCTWQCLAGRGKMFSKCRKIIVGLRTTKMCAKRLNQQTTTSKQNTDLQYRH